MNCLISTDIKSTGMSGYFRLFQDLYCTPLIKVPCFSGQELMGEHRDQFGPRPDSIVEFPPRTNPMPMDRQELSSVQGGCFLSIISVWANLNTFY